MADATSVLNEISGALDGLANQALAHVGEDRSFLEIWGWNLPAINRHEFADLIKSPKNIIQNIDPLSISDEDIEKLKAYPGRIQYASANTIPQLPGGNAFHVYIVIVSLVSGLSDLIGKYTSAPLDIAALEDRKLLPAAQIRVLKKMASGIERLGAESADLSTKINEINAAHSVAESLPADMQTLIEARAQYEAARRRIELAATVIDKHNESATELRNRLESILQEADAVLKRANQAYGAATTVGLGKAFSERASALSTTTWILGLFLLIALGAGAYITFMRVEFVHKLMENPKIGYNILWLNLTFTALSVSAPVWLAWLLTRQIGQRFRLAEDYGYKAAVAKAYEGYRAEAAQIDDELAKRLFSLALDQLGEAPLRLVEKDSPGSPAHEIGGPLSSLLGRSSGGARRTKADEKGGSEEE